MAEYNLYRGTEFFRQETRAGEVRFTLRVRHSSPIDLSHGFPLSAEGVTDHQEVFQYDSATGRHQSQNFAQLPSWVHKEELERIEDEQRRERFDRVTKMMLLGRFSKQ